MVENQKEQSLISQRLIKDHIKVVNGCDASKCDISKKHILSARNAAARYKEVNRLSQAKEIADKNEQREKKRKALEIKENEDHSKYLQLQMEQIEDDLAKLKK